MDKEYSNFLTDVEKIGKEILTLLNNNMPSNRQFIYANPYRGKVRLSEKASPQHEVVIVAEPIYPKTAISANVKWQIYLNLKDRGKSWWDGIIKVSNNEIYTNTELERAKNQILTKIFKFLEL